MYYFDWERDWWIRLLTWPYNLAKRWHQSAEPLTSRTFDWQLQESWKGGKAGLAASLPSPHVALFTHLTNVLMLEVREPRHAFTCSVSMTEFDLPSEVPVSSQSSYWSLLFVPLIPLKIQSIHSAPVYPLRRTMALMSWPLGLYGVNPEGARVESGGHRHQCWFF